MSGYQPIEVTELKKLLFFDPETGLFTWLISPRKSVTGKLAGSSSPECYIDIQVNKKSFRAHRLAWFYHFGVWPIGIIDHINGIKSDNRIINLRDTTPEINSQNRRRARENSLSGMLGASPLGNRWQAEIGVGGKRKYLGLFKSPELAHEAYLKAKREMHVGCTI